MARELAGEDVELGLSSLCRACAVLGAGDTERAVARLRERLAGHVLEVAVVGAFKRGKSTLINRLLERELLPTGVLPLTSVPTVVEHGQETLEVSFADGHAERHPLDRLARFVTEEANPANGLGVDAVVARIPGTLLAQGLRLVDTPGVGSVLEHNTTATTAYLPNLAAAILVTSADPPLSEEERTFLAEVAKHAIKLFVVVNKTDYLGPDDLEQTLAFTDRIVREVVPSWQGRVYPVSARPASAVHEGLARFRADFERFLRTEQLSVAVAAVDRDAAQILARLQLQVALERRAASLSIEELDRRRAWFEQLVRATGDEMAADTALLEAAVRRALSALDEVAALGTPRLKAAVRAATLAEAERHAGLGPGQLLQTFAAGRPRLLEQLGTGLVDEATDAARASFRRGAGEVTARAAARLDRLRTETATAFDVPLPPADLLDVRLAAGAVQFAVPWVPPLAEDLAPVAWRLLGKRAARERAVAKGVASAEEEATILLGRVRGATSAALFETARRLGASLQRHEETLVTELREAIDRGGSLRAEARAEHAARNADLSLAERLLDQAAASLGNRS